MRVEFDEDRIDAIFACVDRCHAPGAAVGIAVRGETVYRKGFGLANLELPVVLSPSIRMRIGSTTKQFTALAYQLLCEQGKAALDDPIGRFLPELHPNSREVTVRHLLGHVSGLRDVHDLCWQLSGTGTPASSEELLALYQRIDDANAAPGVTWIYNNGGYLMVSAAIERLCGRPLEEVFQDCIFEPLGMYDTALRRRDTDFCPNSAAQHTTSASYAETSSRAPSGQTRFERMSLGTLAGEGGIISTVDDMLRWLHHLQHPRVGSEKSWVAMRTPQILNNGTSTGYGLGLMIGSYRGASTLSHPGGVMGGNSQMLTVPGAELDIVVMSNRSDVFSVLLANQILDACLPDLEQDRLKTAQPLTGTFRSPTTGRVVQLFPAATDPGEQIASVDGLDIPMAPDEEGILKPSGIWVSEKRALIPIRGGSAVGAMRLIDFGHIDDLEPVEPSTPSAERAPEGHYRSEATETAAMLLDVGGGLRLRTFGRFGSVDSDLECIGKDLWRAKSRGPMPWGGILSFARDGSSFRYDTFRTRKLTFRRQPSLTLPD